MERLGIWCPHDIRGNRAGTSQGQRRADPPSSSGTSRAVKSSQWRFDLKVRVVGACSQYKKARPSLNRERQANQALARNSATANECPVGGWRQPSKVHFHPAFARVASQAIVSTVPSKVIRFPLLNTEDTRRNLWFRWNGTGNRSIWGTWVWTVRPRHIQPLIASSRTDQRQSLPKGEVAARSAVEEAEHPRLTRPFLEQPVGKSPW